MLRTTLQATNDACAVVVEGGELPARAEQRVMGRGDIVATPMSKLLHTTDVAALFSVTSRTVTNWAANNQLPSLRTPGGQIRFERADVLALIARKADERRFMIARAAEKVAPIRSQ
jgi:excisionase family DNA binding protein